MRIINALMAEWKTKTTAEKVKVVLHVIMTVGGGAVGGTIGDKCSAGKKPFTAVCTRLTGTALGIAASDVAMKTADETVDTIDELIRARKNKEGTENA